MTTVTIVDLTSLLIPTLFWNFCWWKRVLRKLRLSIFTKKNVFHLIHVVFPHLLTKNLATFTEGKRQLFRRLRAHGSLGSCDDVQLKGTDDSFYNFSVFVSLTGRDISTDARKLIKRKAVSTSTTYCDCIFYTYALISRLTYRTYVAQHLWLLLTAILLVIFSYSAKFSKNVCLIWGEPFVFFYKSYLKRFS